MIGPNGPVVTGFERFSGFAVSALSGCIPGLVLKPGGGGPDVTPTHVSTRIPVDVT